VTLWDFVLNVAAQAMGDLLAWLVTEFVGRFRRNRPRFRTSPIVPIRTVSPGAREALPIRTLAIPAPGRRPPTVRTIENDPPGDLMCSWCLATSDEASTTDLGPMVQCVHPGCGAVYCATCMQGRRWRCPECSPVRS
jgi:hypothetical protein